MPNRLLITKELAKLLGVLGHPHRIRIVEELRNRELDVNSLQQILGISHSLVSQNLSILRSHRLVTERREGRHVIYSLLQPKLAVWLIDGLQFLEGELDSQAEIRAAVEAARQQWVDHPQTQAQYATANGTNVHTAPTNAMPGLEDDSASLAN